MRSSLLKFIAYLVHGFCNSALLILLPTSLYFFIFSSNDNRYLYGGIAFILMMLSIMLGRAGDNLSDKAFWIKKDKENALKNNVNKSPQPPNKK